MCGRRAIYESKISLCFRAGVHTYLANCAFQVSLCLTNCTSTGSGYFVKCLLFRLHIALILAESLVAGWHFFMGTHRGAPRVGVGILPVRATPH